MEKGRKGRVWRRMEKTSDRKKPDEGKERNEEGEETRGKEKA